MIDGKVFANLLIVTTDVAARVNGVSYAQYICAALLSRSTDSIEKHCSTTDVTP